MIVPRSRRRYRQLAGRESSDPFETAAPDGFSMRIVQIEGTGTRSPHRHPRSQEAIFVAQGSGYLWESGVGRRLEEGDCALIEPGVAHATLPDPGTRMELICFFPEDEMRTNIEELEGVEIKFEELKKGTE
jgi:quercetin dioxygenase-like cupin family protein